MSSQISIQAVINSLNQTPEEELPQIAPFLASSIKRCSDAVRLASDPATAKKGDANVQFHTLKSRLCSLLQAPSPQARFTGIILVNATIETGGKHVVASSEPWLRGLLAMLNKEDPVSSKKLCLLTITRVFSLTQHSSTLVRDITTPLLPPFLTSCMSLAGWRSREGQESSSFPLANPCLETVLQCLLHLIPHHPNTFRPFAAKIYQALPRLLVSQPGMQNITSLAHSMFVTLHFCAPKNNAPTEWLDACKAVIFSTHDVADRIFRAVIEAWKPSNNESAPEKSPMSSEKLPQSTTGGPLGLPKWQGIYQGSRVMISLLQLLTSFFFHPTSQAVNLPIGLVLDLTTRLLSAHISAVRGGIQPSIHYNPEITHEEREELLGVFPEINHAILKLFLAIARVLGPSALPVTQTVLSQSLSIFDLTRLHEGVRIAAYDLVSDILPFFGSTMSRDNFKPMISLVETCCEDCFSAQFGSPQQTEKTNGGGSSSSVVNGHIDALFLREKNEVAAFQSPRSAVRTSAVRLLCHVLKFVPAGSIARSARAQIDRVAVLGDQKQILLASVLNPELSNNGKHKMPSLLPFLARNSSYELGVEALLRPRLPTNFQSGIERHGAAAGSDDLDGLVDTSSYEIACSTELTEQPMTSQSFKNEHAKDNHILERPENSLGVTEQVSTSSGVPAMNGTTLQADARSLDAGTAQTVKRNHEETRLGVESLAKRLRTTEDNVRVGNPKLAPELTSHAISVPQSDISQPADHDKRGSEALGHKNDSTPKDTALHVPSPARSPCNEIVTNELMDDGSDFEMPTLYLKTSSEEGDEEEGDNRDFDDYHDPV